MEAKKFLLRSILASIIGTQSLALEISQQKSIKLESLSETQLNNAKKIYLIGRSFRGRDGKTFEEELTSIALRESSLCKFNVGDQYYKSSSEKPFSEKSLGCFQIKVSTAQFTIRTNKLTNYYELLKNTTKLANKLHKDIEFNTLIAGNYFLWNYERAHKEEMWNPTFKAISRHNGGWNNTPYFKKVSEDKKTIRQMNLQEIPYTPTNGGL